MGSRGMDPLGGRRGLRLMVGNITERERGREGIF